MHLVVGSGIHRKLVVSPFQQATKKGWSVFIVSFCARYTVCRQLVLSVCRVLSRVYYHSWYYTSLNFIIDCHLYIGMYLLVLHVVNACSCVVSAWMATPSLLLCLHLLLSLLLRVSEMLCFWFRLRMYLLA